MAKWYGVIGYAESVKIEPGVYGEEIIEYHHYGEVIRNSRRLQTVSNSTNDDINISNQLSIIADPYASQNFHKMRYAEFMGTKWKITDIEVQYPRLTLTLGGVYNGVQA